MQAILDGTVTTTAQEDRWTLRRALAVGEARGVEIGEARGVGIGEARGIEIGEARGIEIGEARGVEIGEARGRRSTLLAIVAVRWPARLVELEQIDDIDALEARVLEPLGGE